VIPHVAATVASLQAAYGSRFRFDPSHAAIWDRLLGEFTRDRLQAATLRVIDSHRHGAPGAAEIRQAVLGCWEARKTARTDCNLNPAPQTLGWVVLTCLVDPTSGQVIRAFNPGGDLVEWPNQRVLTAAADVPEALMPPSSPAQVAAVRDSEQLEGPGRVDFAQAIEAPNLHPHPDLAAQRYKSQE